MYKKQQQAFWTAEEIDFAADINDYNKLNANEKLFVENVNQLESSARLDNLSLSLIVIVLSFCSPITLIIPLGIF